MKEVKGHILIVDNARLPRGNVVRKLRAEGYDCITAADGKDVLKIMTAQRFDLVLLDTKILQASGMQLLAQLTADQINSCVVMTAVEADLQTAIEAMKLGAYDYVIKPFILSDLVVRIERTLERRRLVNENRDYKLHPTETAVGELEQQYPAILNNIADTVLILTEGTITWCNDQVEEVLGYKKDELIGKEASIFFPEEINPSEFARAVYAETADQKRFQSTTKVIGKSGRIIDIEFTISRVSGNLPLEFVVVARDITERRILEEEHEALESIYDEHSHILSQFYVDLEAAKEALRDSEERFRSVAETASDAIITTDTNGNIVFWNKAATSMFGYKVEEALGKPLALMMPKRMRQAYNDGINQITSADVSKIAGKPVEQLGLRKDGSEFPVELSLATWRTAKDVFFTVIIRDVTERKQAEEALQRAHDELEIRVEERTADLATANNELQIEVTERKRAEAALRQSEAKYRTIFENSAVAITVTDETERIVSWNKLAEVLLGMDENDFYMKPVSTLYPEVEWRKIRSQNLRRKGMRHYLETRMVKKNGEIIDVDLSVSVLKGTDDNVIGSIGIIADISERKKAEEALRESEARFHTIFEDAAMGIALLDLNGNALEINPALQKMIGYNLAELRSMPAGDLTYSEESSTDRELFKEMLAGKRDHYSLEKRYIRKDGSEMWSHQTLSMVCAANGEPRFAIAMVEDITKRRKAEEEKKRMEQQLNLAGRLAAVGELAAGVAHELNNPLTAVQGFAQLLASRVDLDESIKGDVEIIFTEAKRAAKITDNLLSFAQRNKPEKRLISINEVIERSLELNAYQLRTNNIEVSLELDPDLPMTMADFPQMQQVFMNIISNAENAMTDVKGGGELVVKTQAMGEMIQMTFTDNGPGIPDDDLRRVFDPFYTTKSVGKGMGLGLSICYGIVHGHGGHLYAASKHGKGTSFVVEIPIISEDQYIADQYSLLQEQGAGNIGSSDLHGSS